MEILLAISRSNKCYKAKDKLTLICDRNFVNKEFGLLVHQLEEIDHFKNVHIFIMMMIRIKLFQVIWWQEFYLETLTHHFSCKVVKEVTLFRITIQACGRQQYEINIWLICIFDMLCDQFRYFFWNKGKKL